VTDLLSDLETFLRASSVVGSATVFRDTIRETEGMAIALYEYMGTTPIPQIDGATRAVQVVVRDKSATAAKEKARELYNVLAPDDSGIKYLTNERWCLLNIKQPPFKIKVDEEDRSYYGFNIDITTYTD